LRALLRIAPAPESKLFRAKTGKDLPFRRAGSFVERFVDNSRAASDSRVHSVVFGL
jgi:hypothetical protein